MSEKTAKFHLNKILIVDDTAANLQLLTNILTEQGYTVYPSSDGELALRFVQSTLPDLILLDIKMPGIDGFEVCRRLKADEKTSSIPIIFISILENERDKVKGFQAGGVDFITKPFHAQEVLARIRLHLHLRELTDHLEQKVSERTNELMVVNQRLQVQITERKQAEKDRKKSDERFRRLSENAQDVFYRMSLPDGNYEYVNSSITVLSGYTPEEVYRAPGLIGKIIHPDWHEYLEEQWSKLLKGDMLATYEYPIIHKSGEMRWWNQRNILIRDTEGHIVAIEGIVTDVTERKEAEESLRQLNRELDQRVLERTAQLEASNKELEAFAYSVSHDLRAPLRHIDGFMELVKIKMGPALDQQGKHYMDTISDAAQKMGQLIDNLLSFSRMGRHALLLQPLDLGALVREIKKELEPDMVGRQIEWCINDLPTVEGDAALLRMALTNLITNALKFTRTRKLARIEIGTNPGKPSETVVFVCDNGVGFNMTYVDKLFGVFQRLHHADEFEGTGIGLANVRRIIERHGGRTWAKGEPDKGAVFFFSLPKKQQGVGHTKND